MSSAVSWVINRWWHWFQSVVCFDFCSTNVVQLCNRNLYFYQFRCHHPLITQLNWDHSAFFQRMRWKFGPSTLLSNKDITALTFDWSTVLWLVERNVEGQNLHRLWYVKIYGNTGYWVFKQGMQNLTTRITIIEGAPKI